MHGAYGASLAGMNAALALIIGKFYTPVAAIGAGWVDVLVLTIFVACFRHDTTRPEITSEVLRKYYMWLES